MSQPLTREQIRNLEDREILSLAREAILQLTMFADRLERILPPEEWPGTTPDPVE